MKVVISLGLHWEIPRTNSFRIIRHVTRTHVMSLSINALRPLRFKNNSNYLTEFNYVVLLGRQLKRFWWWANRQRRKLLEEENLHFKGWGVTEKGKSFSLCSFNSHDLESIKVRSYRIIIIVRLPSLRTVYNYPRTMDPLIPNFMSF